MMNIVDPIIFQCAVQPRAIALCAPGTGISLVSYRRLLDMIFGICARIRKLGIKYGDVVAVEIEDPIFCVAVILSLARLGIVTLSRFDERIVETLTVNALIADKYPAAPKVDQIILADLSWIKFDSSNAPNEQATTFPDDLCRLVLTSGTTGIPKAVPVTHRRMAARIARHDTVFTSRFANCSRIFGELAISTSLGFQVLLGTLWRGGAFFFPGKNFDLTIDAFEEYRGG
jgi:acyl-coenzyme A synthetase/AMP-(fatty) acid ligase